MKHTASFIAGLLCGALLFGGTYAYAVGSIAEPSTHRVFVDGKEAKIEAYLVDGHNYFKLRDIGEQLGFNVYWDEGTQTVQIESGTPYTGEPPVVSPTVVPTATPSMDYSAGADPSVFTSVYTREAYNAVSEVLEGVRAGDLSRTGIVHYNNAEDAQTFNRNLFNLSNGITVSMRFVETGAYEIYAHRVDRDAAEKNTDPLIREISGLSDREKILRINKWICDNVIYNPKAYALIDEIGAGAPIEGNCASISSVTSYLCARTGILCIRAQGESHFWNAIYTDGKWSFIDVSLNDQVWGYQGLLFGEAAPKKMDDPDGLRFLQELLVPGSTST